MLLVVTDDWNFHNIKVNFNTILIDKYIWIVNTDEWIKLNNLGGDFSWVKWLKSFRL